MYYYATTQCSDIADGGMTVYVYTNHSTYVNACRNGVYVPLDERVAERVMRNALLMHGCLDPNDGYHRTQEITKRYLTMSDMCGIK